MVAAFQVGRTIQSVFRSAAEQGIQANNQEGEIADMNAASQQQIQQGLPNIQQGNPNIQGLA